MSLDPVRANKNFELKFCSINLSWNRCLTSASPSFVGLLYDFFVEKMTGNKDFLLSRLSKQLPLAPPVERCAAPQRPVRRRSGRALVAPNFQLAPAVATSPVWAGRRATDYPWCVQWIVWCRFQVGRWGGCIGDGVVYLDVYLLLCVSGPFVYWQILVMYVGPSFDLLERL